MKSMYLYDSHKEALRFEYMLAWMMRFICFDDFSFGKELIINFVGSLFSK